MFKLIPLLITGIVAIVILELYALSQGIDGILLTTVIGIICAMSGFGIGKVLRDRKAI